MLLLTSVRDIYNWDTSGESRDRWKNISLDQTLFLSLWSKPDLGWSRSHSFDSTAEIWPYFPQRWESAASATAARGPWGSSYAEHKVHVNHAATLGSRWPVYWCQPSAVAAFASGNQTKPKAIALLPWVGMQGACAGCLLHGQQIAQPRQDRVTHRRACGRFW